ncbi:MAG: PTS fructose transporter subunit IIC [Clostridiaceae bacterium]
MKIVAITSCPTGIAHTYMAAEALQLAAKEMGHEIKVETQGSVGAENVITGSDLKEADAVIIAADTKIDLSRFAGMPMVKVSVSDAVKDSKSLIEKALRAKPSGKKADTQTPVAEEKEKLGIYKHLMNGVSFMIPFVAGGGMLIALGFALGGIYVFNCPGTIAEALFVTGKGAFALMLPIFSGYIAYSIADRPGLAPGMVGGAFAAGNIFSGQFLAQPLASGVGGFLGAVITGYAAGYLALGLKKVKLHKNIEGLKPVLLIPLFSTAILGVVYVFILSSPLVAMNTGLLNWLKGLSGTNAAILGLILGLMMTFDLGGPFNKAAYVFGTGTIVAGGSPVMAAVMAAGMVPPLGAALASTVIARKKFTEAEIESGKGAWALGASFISEGAITFAAADPLRVIPCFMVGGGVTGALSMIFGCKLIVPHGGIWVLPIPNVITNLTGYGIAIVAGTVVTGVALSIVKKDITK